MDQQWDFDCHETASMRTICDDSEAWEEKAEEGGCRPGGGAQARKRKTGKGVVIVLVSIGVCGTHYSFVCSLD